jgi:hypothetical protein
VVGLYPNLEEDSGHLVIGGQAGDRRKRACDAGRRVLGMNRLAALDGNGERVCSCLPMLLNNGQLHALEHLNLAGGVEAFRARLGE